MLPIIEQHRSHITQLCRRHGVRRLDLFGSAATGTFADGCSDLDFLVDFLESKPQGAADRYFGLLDGLQEVLGRTVDLVMRNAIRNPYFRNAADSEHLNLYAA
jgi:predicted nucleotidyltransferase